MLYVSVCEARLKELKQELLNSNQILLWVGDVGQRVVKKHFWVYQDLKEG